MRSGARRAIAAELVSRLNAGRSAQVTLVTGVLIVTEYSTMRLGISRGGFLLEPKFK